MPIYTPGKLVLAKDSVATDPNFDPNFANVSLLLHGDGTNGSTTITDNSPSPKTVTAVGNAQISTAQSKFGGSSIAFDGSGDSLAAPASISHFGTGDFTIELWIYQNSATPHGIQEARVEATATPWLWYFDGSNLVFFNGTSYQTTGTVPSSQWVHIAISRSSGIVRQFINGNKESENTITTDLTTAASNTLLMRARDVGSDVLNGYIDEYRVTSGVARYTANFTPPTTPFPDR
jgi:hypothetical protein